MTRKRGCEWEHMPGMGMSKATGLQEDGGDETVIVRAVQRAWAEFEAAEAGQHQEHAEPEKRQVPEQRCSLLMLNAFAEPALGMVWKQLSFLQFRLPGHMSLLLHSGAART